MAKQKKSILILSFLAAFCATIGVSSLASEPVEASAATGTTNKTVNLTSSGAQKEFLVKDSFNKKGSLSSYNYYSYSNATKDTGSETNVWGIVPGESWGGAVSGGDANVVYKVGLQDHCSFENLTFSFSSVFTCAGLSEYYGKDKTNIVLSVSTDNVAYTPVFDMFSYGGENGTYSDIATVVDANGNAVSGYSELPSNDLANGPVWKATVNLTSAVQELGLENGGSVYIKLDMLHLTAQDLSEEHQSSGAVVSGGKIVLQRTGIRLHEVSIRTNQKLNEDDVYVFDNFDGAGALSSFAMLEYSGVSKDTRGNAEWGLIPATTWATTMDVKDAYLTYYIPTRNTKVFSDLALRFELGSGHESGLYWHNSTYGSGTGVPGVNLLVSVNDDNGSEWTEVYNYHQSVGSITSIQESRDANHGALVDLTKYAEGKDGIYVKIDLKHAEKTVGHDNVGLLLHNVAFAGSEKDIAESGVEYYYSKNYRESKAFDDVYVKGTNVTSDTNGQYAYGLIPSNAWDGTVTAGTGSAVYQLPLNGNGTFTNFNALSMNLEYYLANKNGAGLTVAYNYDNGDEWTTAFTATAKGKTVQSAVDLTAAATSESALSAKSLFVKVTLQHNNGSFSLGNLGVLLFNVEFKGMQNFAMEKGASVRLDGNNGIRFTTLVDTDVVAALEEKYAEVSYGTFIMPKDYIATYGELTLENLFGDEAVYCWGGKVEGKTQILHRKSLLTEEYADGYHAFKYSIVNIHDSNLTRQFVGLGYIECVDSEGEKTYILASYAGGDVEKTARSVAYVAQKEVETNGEGAEICQSEYLNKLTAEQKITTYTVVHVVYTGSQNLLVKSVAVYQAEIGQTVRISYSTGFGGYSGVDQTRIGIYEKTSQLTGTVLADGQLVLYVYYRPTVA